MLQLSIPTLSCGHCVRAVTETLHELDPQSQVSVDLPSKTVRVETSQTEAAVRAALADAGYDAAA